MKTIVGAPMLTDDPSHIRKRSVRLAGHQTSISIEDAFWEQLLNIAKADGLSINALITDIDAKRSGNLSSAIRIFVLDRVLNPDADAPT